MLFRSITASTNLSDAEIDKAVREAAEFANEDKQRKEEVEARNHADQLIYTTEKSLKDLGDKLSADDQARVTQEIDALKQVLETGTPEEVRNATEKAAQVTYEIFGKIYQQTAQEGGAEGFDPNAQANYGQGDTASDPNVVDADYQVVDDDEEK